MKARAVSFAAAVALLPAIVACGGAASDGDAPPADSPLLTLLGAVPDAPGIARFVSYADLDAYYAALGVGAPPQGGSADAMNDWLRELVEAATEDAAPLVGGSEFALAGLRDPQAYRDEIGLDPADVGQSLEAGQPPETYHVLRGEFDAEPVDDAVRNDPRFSDLLEEASHGDVSYYSWGEDFEQDLRRISPVHTLGRGGRLALYDGLLFWSFWTGGMTGMIDAAAGVIDSLADREDFGAMASELDRMGVYWVQMAGDAETPGDVEGPLLAPYVSIAAGGGVDGEVAFLALVIAHKDAASAEENVSRLQQWLDEGSDLTGTPWTQRIESSEISSNGVLTIAKLRGPDLPWDVLVSGLTLLGHE